MVGKKGFTENFRGISLYHKKIGVDCSSSLPYRQLRKSISKQRMSKHGSLPYRQLRNLVSLGRRKETGSLPYRQLRNQNTHMRTLVRMFTAVQAA